MIRIRSWWLAILAVLVMPVVLVWGFAEEPIPFVDPNTGQTVDPEGEISTIHDDLTYALALVVRHCDFEKQIRSGILWVAK